MELRWYQGREGRKLLCNLLRLEMEAEIAPNYNYQDTLTLHQHTGSSGEKESEHVRSSGAETHSCR